MIKMDTGQSNFFLCPFSSNLWQFTLGEHVYQPLDGIGYPIFADIDICPLFAKGHLYFHNGTSTIWRIDISYLWAPEPLSSALFSFCHQMVNFAIFNLLSGKHNYGKSPCSMGKSTINHNFQWVNPLLITIFNSYVSHYQRVPVHLCHVGQSLHLERVPRCPGFVYVNDHGPIHRDCSNSQGLGTQHHSLKMGYTLKYPQHFTFQQGK